MAGPGLIYSSGIMSEERRGGRRTPISGVKVTYESASGEQIEADVLDLASGGLFIRTEAPLSVGKRIAVDLNVVGEPVPWSALGRIVWVRAAAEPGRPAGMGVKLIDMDDATLEAIQRLVETREPTAPGVGDVSPVVAAPVIAAAPDRERTLMGVGMGSEPPPANPPSPPPAPAPASPPAEVKAPEPPPPVPARASGPPREQSVAIDLVAEKRLPKSVPPPAQAESGGGPGRWVVVLLLLAVAGIAAYVLLDGFLRPLGK
jgi:uncharacterized protein (TIGR02266 family)